MVTADLGAVVEGREGAVELEPVERHPPVALGPRRGVEGVLVYAHEAIEFVFLDGPDRIRAAGRLGHAAFVPPHAPSARLNLAQAGLNRIQCPHHVYRAATEEKPVRATAARCASCPPCTPS